MENEKAERQTVVGAGRENRFGQIEIEMQKCMTGRLQLGLKSKVKLGLRSKVKSGLHTCITCTKMTAELVEIDDTIEEEYSKKNIRSRFFGSAYTESCREELQRNLQNIAQSIWKGVAGIPWKPRKGQVLKRGQPTVT